MLLVLLPISVALVIPVSLLAYAGFLAFIIATSPKIEVTAAELRAGRAHIARDAIGEITVVSPERTRMLLSVDSDARAFLVIRSWIAQSVRVEITDSDDPTPFWLISSRRPQLLRDALSAPTQ